MYANGETPARYGAIDVIGISYCPISISAPAVVYMTYGQRRDTTKTNTSKFDLQTIWSCLQNKPISPRTPEVKPIGGNYVVIYMACNDSLHIIKSIMEEKEYHERCRECMGNPRTMVELEPA